MSVQRALEVEPGLDAGVVDEDEEALRKAIALSREDMEVEDEEADLRRAIQLSMLGKWHHTLLTLIIYPPT